MNTRFFRKEPVKNQILHRLKIARGHLQKVIEMVEEDKYCIDVINQSQAVQMALKKVDEIVLKNHLQSCVIGEAKKGKIDEEKLIEEILAIFRRKE